MVSVNADAYRAADNGESVITEAVIGTSDTTFCWMWPEKNVLK